MLNIDEIKEMLMDKQVTLYWIASRADVPQTNLARYRNGESKIENMKIGTAQKLGAIVNEWKALH